MGKTILEMIDIKKSFSGIYALSGINFSLEMGEVHALLGENGAGKSTLIKVLGGIYKPDSGTIKINGQEVEINGVSDAQEKGIGIIHQEIVLVPYLTVAQNLFLGREIKTKFGTVDMRDFLDMPIKNYSSGMAARLGFAIATIVKPDILICDEVLSVGDYAFQKKCEKRMNEMRAAGTTLLYVSHSIESVQKICDHALWLQKGIVKGAGNVDEIAKQYMDSLA